MPKLMEDNTELSAEAFSLIEDMILELKTVEEKLSEAEFFVSY